ncbi:MAG: ABC transporter ATP-binding protein/permease [Lachnospiraceae bacterium]|nr:ABC transporter ATP-binding protein/permease [Lachnospiraceae bacterium]
MLQIKNIRKQYKTGDLVQTALDDVSLSFRDHELVSILGPSGSGKTTLLNIIGGLDRYDSGDLIINGVSTKEYSDRDWDTYRNHSIGFVFQSYNLIPHQSVLSNVELALTISGISKAERTARAKKALEQVGLGEQIHKKPTQMSGGQMQRVAIARALVNNPEILLADEPTGALDTKTGIQVMDLLKEVAKDRLVVMVTHNPDLAEQYSTRIVRVQDGHVISDTNPPSGNEILKHGTKPKKLASMSFLTALGLSGNNLRTKKGRTAMTSIAGSIGIIGIALILALSSGVKAYIQSIEEDTLSEYPIDITKASINLSSMLTTVRENNLAESDDDYDISVSEMLTTMFSEVSTNDLASFKEYLESAENEITKNVKAIEYRYNFEPQIYLETEDGPRKVNPDTSFGSSSYSMFGGSSMMSMGASAFSMLPEQDSLYKDQYEVMAGEWPENDHEAVLVLSSNGSINDYILYPLGLKDYKELDDLLESYADGDELPSLSSTKGLSYEDVLGRSYKVVCASRYYEYEEDYDVWVDRTENKEYLDSLVEDGEDLTIVGIVQPKEDATSAMLSPGINYPYSLMLHMTTLAADSEAVKAQLDSRDTNIFTGDAFSDDAGGFDMDSLLTIDSDALSDMFSMSDSLSDLSLDTSALDFSDASANLDFGSLNLSGMIDMGDLSLGDTELDLSGLDLSSMFENVNIRISGDALASLASDLLSGYQSYLSDNPDVSYESLVDGFNSYLNSDAARSILADELRTLVEENIDLTVNTDSVATMLQSILDDFQSYISENMNDDGTPSVSTADYIASGRAQAIFDAWAAENISASADTPAISTDDLQKVASAVLDGYNSYADENDLTSFSDVGSGISEYLDTEEAKEALSRGVREIIDTDALEQQFTQAITMSMSTIMSAYGEAISTAIGENLSVVVESMMSQLGSSITTLISNMMVSTMGALSDSLAGAMNFDEDAFADAFRFNLDGDTLTEMLTSMTASAGTDYDSNLKTLGYVDYNDPYEILLYPVDFDSKERVTDAISAYNTEKEAAGLDDQVITYTDFTATMMSSVTTIVDTISYVLIAFVAVSLIVSSIMISIITQISVLERTKEIGILRAIGASKRNISQVFNAETFLIGGGSGLIGILVSELLIIPINMVIHSVTDDSTINAILAPHHAVILILISIVITVLSGLIPARNASKKDPVIALRSE